MGKNDISDELIILRRVFIERIIIGLFFMVCAGLPLSLSRISVTGFLPIYIAHILVAMLLIISFIKRKKWSINSLIRIALSIFLILSIAGPVTWGIVQWAIGYALLASFLVAYTFGSRSGIIMTLLYFLFIIVVAYLYISEILSFPGDVNQFLKSPLSW